ALPISYPVQLIEQCPEFRRPFRAGPGSGLQAVERLLGGGGGLAHLRQAEAAGRAGHGMQIALQHIEGVAVGLLAIESLPERAHAPQLRRERAAKLGAQLLELLAQVLEAHFPPARVRPAISNQSPT